MPLSPQGHALVKALHSLKGTAHANVRIIVDAPTPHAQPKVFVDLQHAGGSAHTALAVQAETARLLSAATDWALHTPLLHAFPSGLTHAPPHAEPASLWLRMVDGVAAEFHLSLRIYAPGKRVWENRSSAAKLRPDDLAKLLRILEHFQGPFACWGHLSASYVFTSLMGRDRTDAGLLERLLNSPRSTFGRKVEPMPKSLILACHEPEIFDLSTFHQA